MLPYDELWVTGRTVEFLGCAVNYRPTAVDTVDIEIKFMTVFYG